MVVPPGFALVRGSASERVASEQEVSRHSVDAVMPCRMTVPWLVTIWASAPTWVVMAKEDKRRDATEVDIVVVGAGRSGGGEVLHGVGAEARGVEGEGVSATTAQQDVVAAKP